MQIFAPSTNKRLLAKVSIIDNARATEVRQIRTLEILFRRIKESAPLKRATIKAREALKKSQTSYKKVKESESYAFLIGEFHKRNDSSCTVYVPCLVFDIDGLENEIALDALLSDCKRIPYIFAAFPSLSGRGIRIMVWTESTPDTHKHYYKHIAEQLSRDLSLPTDKTLKQENGSGSSTGHIDTSTSNISRIWYINHVDPEQFYLNRESETIVMNKENVADNSTQPINGSTLSGHEVISICHQMASKRANPSQRNNFTFQLACIMNEHGISKQEILTECLKRQEKDFPAWEIKKTVNSAVKSSEHGRYTIEQLNSWNSKVDAKRGTKSSTKKKRPAANTKKDSDLENKSKFNRIKSYLDKKYEFRLNVISNDIEYKRRSQEGFQVLNDNDLLCELYEKGLTGIETLLYALLKSNFVPEYDPFKAYFDSLPEWDGQTDHIGELADFVQASDQEWFNLQFRKMIVRSVACALNRIPFNKHCFTLHGNQNDGKTSFLRFLCPPALKPYFKENLDIHHKDGRFALCQNFFVNLDELATFSKYDINKTKALFTVQTIKERMPYDRKPTVFARRASFIASTNSDEFLIDETGNIRWLVFDINGINHDNGGKYGYDQNIDIDLVYSQAIALMRSGFKFQLTKAEIAKSESNNKGYQVQTVELGLIQDRLIPGEEDEKDSEFMTATQILRMIELDTKQKLNVINVGRALQNLGFEKVQHSVKHEKTQVSQQKKGYWVRSLDENL